MVRGLLPRLGLSSFVIMTISSNEVCLILMVTHVNITDSIYLHAFKLIFLSLLGELKDLT